MYLRPALRRGIVAPALALAVTAAAQQAAVPAAPTAFVHVAVIPMDRERILSDQTVVVRDGHIVALGSATKVRVPANATRVDGRGKFLIPGLADMHAHLHDQPWFLSLDPMFGRGLSPADRLLVAEQRLFLWLAHGLTTVRNLDHAPFQFEDGVYREQLLQLRARAAVGAILSPRIYTSGYIAGQLTRPDQPGAAAGPPALLQLAEVAEAVRTYKAAGFDFIKAHPATLGGGGDTSPVFDSLAATARRAGLPIVGHTVVPLARALQTYTSIEHLTGYTDGAADAGSVLPTPSSMAELDALAPKIRELAVATRKAGVWNCPTLYNAFRNGEFVNEGPLPLALKQRLVKALQDAGAGLLAGSDRLSLPRWYNRADSTERAKLRAMTAPERRFAAAYGDAEATHRELEAFVEAGLTPYQALATATRNPAVYFGTLDSTGTIAVGKRADLVLVHGNPLRDIRQTRRIAGVMRGGRWLDRAELDRRTAEIGAWLDQRCAAASSAGHVSCPDPLLTPP